MPNRIIRDGILSSRRVNKLTWVAEVFYRRLMSIVDDYGRCEMDAEEMRSKLYPIKVDTVSIADVSKWMLATVEAGLVSTYLINRKHYLQIIDFRQQIRSKSKYPDFEQKKPCDCPFCAASDIIRYQMISNDVLDVSVFVSGGVADININSAQVQNPEIPFPLAIYTMLPEEHQKRWLDFLAVYAQKHGNMATQTQETIMRSWLSLPKDLQIKAVDAAIERSAKTINDPRKFENYGGSKNNATAQYRNDPAAYRDVNGATATAED